MAFAKVPKISKSQINKAGQILAKDKPDYIEYINAIDLAEQWRACHAYPINTFQATLKLRLRDFPGSIAAQRLKRMPTIIDKLKRYPAMQLTTMQDIGGIRAVLNSVNDVYELADKYRSHQRFLHELVDTKDYIKYPRSEDGYRSLHLVYKYKNKTNPHYDGLRLELQIRSKLQHIWATAVETMGTFLGQALKSRQGDQAWIDFFAITSSAFSFIENTSPLPRFKELSQADTFHLVTDSESKLEALDKMRGFSVAVDAITKGENSEKKSFYHLITLKSLENVVEIKAYDRKSFDQALKDYSNVESEAANGAKYEPVLVSAGPLSMLRRAYPNFFLDISEFVTTIEKIISHAKTQPNQQLKLTE